MSPPFIYVGKENLHRGQKMETKKQLSSVEKCQIENLANRYNLKYSECLELSNHLIGNHKEPSEEAIQRFKIRMEAFIKNEMRC